MPLTNFLQRIRASRDSSEFIDEFMLAQDNEYLFLLSAVARDLIRFEHSVSQLAEFFEEQHLIEAHKVDKATPPEGAIKIDVAGVRLNDPTDEVPI
jgi:hypothetical protein